MCMCCLSMCISACWPPERAVSCLSERRLAECCWYWCCSLRSVPPTDCPQARESHSTDDRCHPHRTSAARYTQSPCDIHTHTMRKAHSRVEFTVWVKSGWQLKSQQCVSCTTKCTMPQRKTLYCTCWSLN